MAQGAREQLSGLVAARPHITSARTARIPHAAIRAEDPPASPLQSVCGLGRHAKLPPSEGAVWGCTPMPEAVAHRHIGNLVHGWESIETVNSSSFLGWSTPKMPNVTQL